MSDVLLDLSRNPQARKLVKTLGLPIPMPQLLARSKGPREERPLAGAEIAVRTTSRSALGRAIVSALAQAGANTHAAGLTEVPPKLAGAGEAYGRPVKCLDLDELGDARFDALVFDATGIKDPAGLDEVYAFFHPLVRRIAKSGRAVIVSRPPEEASNAAEAAARTALEGFTRSLGKELGKKGITANLLYVGKGADARLEGPLRFFTSPRSAYVDGQAVRVTRGAGAEPGDTPWLRPLEGKTALVTGAARGIGKATAKILADEGAHVVILDRPADSGTAAQVARQLGGSVLAVDVTASDAAEIICRELTELRGGVDIVVHNAGVTRDKTIANMKPEAWDLTVDVSLSAAERITTALLQSGTLRDHGRVICLSSIAGIAGNMGQTNYAAAKAGIVGYIRHLAPEVEKRGITVNAVAPGFIETRMTAAIPVAIREVARRMNSLGQGGQPQDVGELITFLSTPGAVGVTGQVIRVCGQSLVGA